MIESGVVVSTTIPSPIFTMNFGQSGDSGAGQCSAVTSPYGNSTLLCSSRSAHGTGRWLAADFIPRAVPPVGAAVLDAAPRPLAALPPRTSAKFFQQGHDLGDLRLLLQNLV